MDEEDELDLREIVLALASPEYTEQDEEDYLFQTQELHIAAQVEEQSY